MDMLLKAVDRFKAAEAAANVVNKDLEGTAAERELHAAIENIASGGYLASTIEGAMTALRLALAETKNFEGGPIIGPLLTGAMAYFDKIDDAHGTAFGSAMTMVEGLDLSRVRDNGWMAVYDGLTLAAHGIEGIMQRPQCQSRGEPNAAGRYLEAIAEFLFDERRRAMELLLSRQVDAESNIETLVRLQWLAYDSNGEDLDELESAVVAAKQQEVRA